MEEPGRSNQSPAQVEFRPNIRPAAAHRRRRVVEPRQLGKQFQPLRGGDSTRDAAAEQRNGKTEPAERTARDGKNGADVGGRGDCQIHKHEIIHMVIHSTIHRLFHRPDVIWSVFACASAEACSVHLKWVSLPGKPRPRFRAGACPRMCACFKQKLNPFRSTYGSPSMLSSTFSG